MSASRPPFSNFCFLNEVKQGCSPPSTFINLHSLFFPGVLFMAKRRNPKKAAAKKIPVRTDTVSVENETIKRVNHTIATIERFLAKWNASDIKPRNMLPEIVKIRKFHYALSNWQSGAVRAQGRENEESRLRRLQDFVAICNSYS